MNSIVEIIQECKRAGITLQPQSNGNIKAYPVDKVTTDIVNHIKENKPTLFAVLSICDVFDGHLIIEESNTLH